MAKKENKNVHELIQKIDGDTWKSAIDKVFLEKQKTVKVDGFRQGKVPRNIYEQKFGKESLFLDAANHVLNDAYVKMMEESKLIPVVQPSVDIKSISEDGVEFDYNNNILLKGHGEKSVMLLSNMMTLTDEEILCIRYHMGAYNTDEWDLYDRAIRSYQNVLWTHTADMFASKVMGV